jgi:hypothetical protein
MTKTQRKKSLTSKRNHYVTRILAAWHNATPLHLAQGTAWYDRAQDAARAMHPNVLIGAGVIAALSPRTGWKQNKIWATRVCSAALNNAPYPPSVSTYQRLDKAWKIAQLVNPTSEQILAILNGPKTCRFFRNITGDLHAVTIDIWAQRIATGIDSSKPPRGAHYDALESGYQMAAAVLGVNARDVQAAVWVSVRGTAE